MLAHFLFIYAYDFPYNLDFLNRRNELISRDLCLWRQNEDSQIAQSHLLLLASRCHPSEEIGQSCLGIT